MEDLALKRLINALQHLIAMQSMREHGDEHSIHFQTRIDTGLHLFYGLHQQSHATQRKELGSHRDDHAIRRGQRIHREQAQRRLAINDDHVIFILDLSQHASQHLFTSNFGDQLHLGGR